MPWPAAAADGLDAAGDALARPHGNTYWLLPSRVLAGEHPGAGGSALLATRLAGLRDAGVTLCIDLTGDLDPVAAYQPLPVDERPARREAYPIADFGVPSVAGMRRVLDRIGVALAEGETVYLHCRAGIGRTGTVAACLLVELGLTPEAALALLQRKWKAMTKSALARYTPESAVQREFVVAWTSGKGAVPDGPWNGSAPQRKGGL